MSIHILGGGMCNDITSPLKRTAIDRSGESIIHNKWHTVAMGYSGKFLNVEHLASGIGDRLTEEGLGVGTERFLNFLLRGILIDKSAFDAQFFHRYSEEIERTAIYLGRSDDMVARLANIEHGIKVGSLPRRGKHCPHSTFEGAYLSCNGITGGIGKTGIKISIFLEVEKHRHLVAVVILEGSALHDRELDRLSVLGFIA